MRLVGRIAVLLLASASAAGLAAPVELSIKESEHYKHKPTKLALPPAIGGLTRGRVAELEGNALDVIIDYRNADGSEVTTLYVYRNAVGDVPLWFDRATKLIEGSHDKYGSVTAVVPTVAFAPPGQASPSGLKVVYSATKPGYTSTALAVLPVSGYYVKARLSSASLTPAQLDARLIETLAAIGWPRKTAAGPAAVPIQDCEAALVFNGEAKPAPKDGASALLSALIPGMVDSMAKSGAGKSTAVRYCRDAYAMPMASVYRPNGDKERYLIAMADAGRGLQVGKNDLSSLLGGGEGKEPTPRYSVDLVLLSENIGFGDYSSLPTPEQAMTLAETAKPTYRTSTIGNRNNISIDSDALGN